MPKVDVFHAWEELVPPAYNTPVVATIHDLAIFRFKELAHPQTLERHTQAYKRLKDRGAHVIAVSETTKRDLIEVLDFDADKIHVIPEAIPVEHIVPKAELLTGDDLKRLYGVNKPYFLWVGTQEPRKNLKRVVEAWRRYAADYDLVIVGAPGTKEIKAETGIILPGYLTNAQLASFYSQASLLLFPSLYEGFGLPILEAFHYGCPVVTGNNSGMSETAGEAATLVDPFSVEAIVRGIKRSLDYKDKVGMQKRMKAQLAKFSWDKAAEKTLAVYKIALRDKV